MGYASKRVLHDSHCIDMQTKISISFIYIEVDKGMVSSSILFYAAKI